MQSIEALLNSQRGDSDGHLKRPAEVSRGGEQAEDSMKELKISTLRLKNTSSPANGPTENSKHPKVSNGCW